MVAVVASLVVIAVVSLWLIRNIECNGIQEMIAAPSPLVCTVVTTDQQMKKLVRSSRALWQWNPSARLFVLTDDRREATTLIPGAHVLSCRNLARFAELDERQLKTLKNDSVRARAIAINHVFELERTSRLSGIWYIDCDVFVTSALPRPPHDSLLATSRQLDGRCVLSQFWLRCPTLVRMWRRESLRVGDPARALADVSRSCASQSTDLPLQVNVRETTVHDSPLSFQASVVADPRHAGLLVNGIVVSSVHLGDGQDLTRTIQKLCESNPVLETLRKIAFE